MEPGRRLAARLVGGGISREHIAEGDFGRGLDGAAFVDASAARWGWRRRALARSLPRKAWKTVPWREGTKGDLVSRFTALRVRPSHRDYWRAEPWPQEWLLIEWPEDKDEPLKYWLSTLPAETAIAMLVNTAKLRWRIERDFQDLKQEIGLDHYEGRGWRGFHHHAALSIAAYGFLVAERSPIPPSAPIIRAFAPKLPTACKAYRPRGAAPT